MPSYNAEKRTVMFGPGERISRRLLLQLTAAGFGTAAFSALLAACGDDGDDDPTATSGSPGAATPTSGAGQATSPLATATGATGGEEPKAGGTLEVAYLEPPSLDPQYHASSSAGNLVGLIYDSLLIQDPYTAEYVAGPLTESFEVSEDTLAWTFHLKQDIVYHDGTPLDAHDIREIYEFAVDPENATFVTGIYLPPNPEFETPDDYTLVISSPLPYGPMASHLFWDSFFGAFPPEARETFGEDFGRNPVGSGPFMFKEWIAGDSMTLERFEEYKWGPSFLTNPGPAYLDAIHFKWTPEQSTIVAGLQSGEIDIAFLPNAFYEQFANDDRFEIITRPSGALTALAWNMERWPFDDLATRQALAHGFDRERFNQVMNEGHGLVMYGTIVPALPHYWAGEQEEGPQYDLELARSMLADAGWEDTDGDGIIEKDGQPFSVVLISGGTEEQVRWSSLAQAQAKELGIDVQIETLEAAALTAQLNSGDYDLFRFGYDTVDPDILAFFFYSPQIPQEGGSGLNRSRVNDARLDELIEKQRNTAAGPERDAAVEELVRYMMDQAICIPLYAPEKHTVVNTRVKGVIYYPNAMDWELTEAWIDE